MEEIGQSRFWDESCHDGKYASRYEGSASCPALAFASLSHEISLAESNELEHRQSGLLTGLLTRVRAIGERANALLAQRWKALRHVTVLPSRIGDIVTAAFVLTTLERGAR